MTFKASRGCSADTVSGTSSATPASRNLYANSTWVTRPEWVVSELRRLLESAAA
ncbi:MAG: hypothetical protein QOE93_165 [Actinomycetota bacterium]|nr:hypothetical protein [Actinomycetota bacterium]